jgi:hypothetical protein
MMLPASSHSHLKEKEEFEIICEYRNEAKIINGVRVQKNSKSSINKKKRRV